MNNNLVIKEINFYGDKLIAVEDKLTNKIYVSVKTVCIGIGLSDGQFKRQKQNLHEDIILSKGITNLKYPTEGGIQEVLCIELNYLPLWLAKIAITPKMQKDNSDVADKLVEYQINAKDALAQAFKHNNLITAKTLQQALRERADALDRKELII